MNGCFYKKDFLSGILFIFFTGIAFVIGLFSLQQALSDLETPTAANLLLGKWFLQFETVFRETLPINTANKGLWGRAEYALFHQGRKGVVIGTEGWLFTDEEFSCPRHAEQSLADNLAFIDNTRKVFSGKNIRLAIVLIPAKVRVLSEQTGINNLPPCRKTLYADVRASLIKKGIAVTELLSVMQSFSSLKSLYLKTDTHWSPTGARLSAQETSKLVYAEFKDLSLNFDPFSSQAKDVKILKGDLTVYMPGVSILSESFTSYVSDVSVSSTDTARNLFGDDVPSVTLVGTSYSANPNWNFEGFLKEALKTDVINMADQGLGPLVVMDKYLQSDAWKNNPPRLVVWEIPERYLLMPHGNVSMQK